VVAEAHSETRDGPQVMVQKAQLTKKPEERSDPAKIGELLRQRGNRLTPQRRAILAIIREHAGHLSADEIYDLAREEVPRLSLSTVYRTLDLLKELDLVSELLLAGDHSRYEAQSHEHQHLICLNCGKVVEFQCNHCSTVHQKLAKEHGFSITGGRVEIFGYCEECARPRHN
jgi:Fur family ferric uptake transcriptional regulator